MIKAHPPARLPLVGALLVAALALAGCGAEEPGSQPADSAPKAAPTTDSSASAPDPGGGPPAGWQKKFTRKQLNTYHAALDRWQQYSTLANDIYREGKDTPAARRVLREYHLFWQREVVILANDYDQGGLRRRVPSEPMWTYARAIKPTQVTIVQCTDYRDIEYTKNGDVLDNRPKHPVTPLVVEMTKPAGRDWMFEGSELKDQRSCAP